MSEIIESLSDLIKKAKLERNIPKLLEKFGWRTFETQEKVSLG